MLCCLPYNKFLEVLKNFKSPAFIRSLYNTVSMILESV